MAKKVVWIVNEYNFPDTIKSRQSNLCRRLNERGYDAYIISGSSSNKGFENKLPANEPFRYVESSEARGYYIRTSDYKKSYERVLVALQFQHRLWKLRDNLPKPDVIVSDFAGLFGNVFLRWKKKYGTRVIYDILDLWPEGFVDMGYIKKDSLIAKYLYGLEHKSYREADGIIFSFQGGRDYIIDKGWSKETGGDVDTSNIGYLNNGVDLEGVDQQRTEFVLDDPDLDSDKFKAIYLGSISAFNGLEVLVETAKVLQDRGEEGIQILVYGFGNKEDELKKMAADYGLKNIKFKGRLDKNYAMNLLSRGDINIFTFEDTPLLKYGTSPNKLFMYFASGKPVLSMIRPGYDLVEGRKAGISVENKPEAVADAMVRFSHMGKEKYQEYCKNSRQLGIEYDYKNLVNVLIEQIEGKKQ
ncbi:MAG: glycosyltransferase family 4 protein [Sphaerochaeta sp.]|jgi:glycosyltransferase involved in cell wall biosynthesis|nr:glycosyltransferase family 4 protein [Sphaerochaeta sp.]